MENRGLLFIPDISGFTQFVNKTDIDHSRLIIQELLEVLINSNQIGLEVSEIEGDAILFYRFGDSPDLGKIYEQVAKMFTEFHRHLGAYEIRRFCRCAACSSAIDLSLKVITHYGEFTGYNVKTFNKLIGRDVIVAHQLLKNDIDQHEYWLVTKNLSPGNSLPDFTQWMKWDSSAKQTESGEISFHYTQLSELKNRIPPEPGIKPALENKVKTISLSREYDTGIIRLFHATGDFRYRHRWQQGVKKVEELTHYLPRVGMRCRCIMENGESYVYYAGSYHFTPDKIEFSTTEEKNNNTTMFTLETTGDNKTRLTLDLYIPRGRSGILFNLFRKGKMENALRQSMLNLDQLVKEVKLPDEVGYEAYT